MAENQNTWFDDPEWDELRNKINKRKSRKLTRKQRSAQQKTPDFSQYHHTNTQKIQPNAAPPPSSQSFQPTAAPRPSYRPVSQTFTTAAPQAVQRPQQPPAQPQTQFQPPSPAKPAQTTQEPFFTPSKDTKRGKPVDAFEAPRDDRPVQVSINLSLPTMATLEPLVNKARTLKKLRSHTPSAKTTKLAGALCAVVLVGAGGFTIFQHFHNKAKSDVLGTAKVAKPTFAVATPEAGVKPENQVLFDPQKKVASYRDEIDGVGVIISQQELPESFKTDPFGQLEKLATSFSATDSFVVNDFKVYIGTSIKGPQSVILVKDKKLIFMRSDAKVGSSAWVKYIETLKTS